MTGELMSLREFILSKLNARSIEYTTEYLKEHKCELREIKEYLLPNGKTVKLFVFKGRFLYMGQATKYSTIIIDEKVFTEHSKDFQDYVILHEYAHIRSPIINVLSFFIPLITLFFGIFVFLSLITMPSIFGVVLLIFLLLVAGLPEVDAEFYAIKILGLNKILSIHKEIRPKKSQKSIINEIASIITHLPVRLIFLFYRVYPAFAQGKRRE